MQPPPPQSTPAWHQAQRQVHHRARAAAVREWKNGHGLPFVGDGMAHGQCPAATNSMSPMPNVTCLSGILDAVVAGDGLQAHQLGAGAVGRKAAQTAEKAGVSGCIAACLQSGSCSASAVAATLNTVVQAPTRMWLRAPSRTSRRSTGTFCRCRKGCTCCQDLRRNRCLSPVWWAMGRARVSALRAHPLLKAVLRTNPSPACHLAV